MNSSGEKRMEAADKPRYDQRMVRGSVPSACPEDARHGWQVDPAILRDIRESAWRDSEMRLDCEQIEEVILHLARSGVLTVGKNSGLSFSIISPNKEICQ